MADPDAGDLLEVNAELQRQFAELREAYDFETASTLTSSWLNMVTDGLDGFTKSGLEQLTQLCRAMAVANPLIRRGLNLRQAYVWGSGVSISARSTGEDGDQDVNAVVQAFLDDSGNQLAGGQSEEICERALGTDGNLFFALFTNPFTGAVQVRRLPYDQIEEVITNPDDASEPWFYLRCWSTTTIDGQGLRSTVARKAYYPDFRYRPQTRTKKIGPDEVYWDAPVRHVMVNQHDGWHFGVGDAFAGLDWARAYTVFLEDWARLVKALSRFAWKHTVPGDKAAAAAAKLGGTLAGAAAVLPMGQNLEAIPKTGATIDSDSGRPLAAMVAAALDVPVTMLLGDPGTVGARATAETLDRPTELMADMRRSLWTDVYLDVLDYVIDQAAKAPQGPLKGTVSRDAYTQREIVTLTGDSDRTIDVVWPPLDETPVNILVAAITAADLTGKLPPLVVARLLLQALGVDDVDEILADLVDEQGQFVDPNVTAGQVAVDAFRDGKDPVDALGDA